jgi:amino acid permease
MKAAVIYFLVLLVHLFGGFADSYTSAHSPQAGDSYKHNAVKAISVMESVFQSKAETQEVADYLIYVEDEDDERNISKKIPTVTDYIFTCSGIFLIYPIFLKSISPQLITCLKQVPINILLTEH